MALLTGLLGRRLAQRNLPKNIQQWVWEDIEWIQQRTRLDKQVKRIKSKKRYV